MSTSAVTQAPPPSLSEGVTTLATVTPMILTFNEEPNIARTLAKLSWASDIVAIDSFSTDGTLAILRADPRVRVFQREFDTAANQCNFGLEQIRTEWVMSMDADYVLSDALVAELKAWNPKPEIKGYEVAFEYSIFGRVLRHCLYPPRTLLYRRSAAHYRDEGHTQRVIINGAFGKMNHPIIHDDRKPLSRWFSQQIRYASRETEHLLSAEPASLGPADRIRRRIIFAPFLVFFYTLFARGLILDGWAGWFYVFQRTVAELLLSLSLLERKLSRSSK
jgi:glycosyltransferase involved in cell wall biosynthesis